MLPIYMDKITLTIIILAVCSNSTIGESWPSQQEKKKCKNNKEEQ